MALLARGDSLFYKCGHSIVIERQCLACSVMGLSIMSSNTLRVLRESSAITTALQQIFQGRDPSPPGKELLPGVYQLPPLGDISVAILRSPNCDGYEFKIFKWRDSHAYASFEIKPACLDRLLKIHSINSLPEWDPTLDEQSAASRLAP
jgi:hypothetical protein